MARHGGDVRPALAAYNGGRKGNRRHPYRNGLYLQKVKRHLAAIEASRGSEL